MRKVIYTSIVGDYDRLMQPLAVRDDYDYICFSNDPHPEAGIWQVRPIPYDSPDSTRLSRYVKLQPHAVLSGYDFCIWIDANIQITGPELYDAAEKLAGQGVGIAQVPHLERDCVYEEAARCYRDGRTSFREARQTIVKLKREGFPRHFGLMENNVILRNLNSPEVSKISDGWWKAYLAGARRDQFCLMPVYWREGIFPTLLFGPGINARNAEGLKIVRHAGRRDPASVKGVKRLPKKLLWTWKRIVSWLFLSR